MVNMTILFMKVHIVNIQSNSKRHFVPCNIFINAISQASAHYKDHCHWINNPWRIIYNSMFTKYTSNTMKVSVKGVQKRVEKFYLWKYFLLSSAYLRSRNTGSIQRC